MTAAITAGSGPTGPSLTGPGHPRPVSPPPPQPTTTPQPVKVHGVTHGTSSAYTYHGCRCGTCRRAANARRAEVRQRHRAEGREPAVHNAAAYTNLGCRCGVCRKANTDAQRERRHRKAGAQ